MKQQYSLNLPLNKILHGHAMQQLKKLPDQSVNCIVTSPPYWALRNYKTTPVIWDENPNCGHVWQSRDFKLHSGRGDAQKSGKYSQQKPVPDAELNDATCQKCSAWIGELGLEPNFDKYIKHLADVFDQCRRVLRNDGTCFVVMGDTYNGSGGAGGDYNAGGIKEGQPKYKQNIQRQLPAKTLLLIPHRFAIEMENRDWTLRNTIIWKKPNCIPSSAKDRFTVDFEYIFFFCKSAKYHFETQYEPFQSITMDEIKQDYKGRAKKDYHSANAQNPSDTKRRIIESMRKKMPPIGGVKKAGGQNPTYSGNTPDWAASGRIKRAVWTINTRGFSGAHFAVFPTALIETPIRAGCPAHICSKCGKSVSIRHAICNCAAPISRGIVLDPFIGSGTTGQVALSQGKDFIGIEMNEDYIRLAEKRLAPFLEATK